MTRHGIVQLTTVHPRNDVRIFDKESVTLASTADVYLLVADGEGAATSGDVRIIDLGSAGGGRIWRAVRGTIAAFRCVRRLHPKILHFHDPESILLALILRFTGQIVIYDVHEDLPHQMMAKEYLPMALRWPIARIAGSVEWIAGQAFNAIVAATPAIAARFPTQKTMIVQNFPQLAEFPESEISPCTDRPPHFVYVGKLSEVRGVREMIAAITNVEARLQLAGTFMPLALETDLKALKGWHRTDFHGWLDRPNTARLVSSARAGLVVLHPIINYCESWPTKMFEYMAAGVPVIASDFPLWREIVDGAGCGVLVDPLDPASISAAMQWMLDNTDEAGEMGKRGRAAIEQRYNWGSEAEKLLTLYRSLLSRESAGA